MSNVVLPIGAIIDWWYWGEQAQIPDGFELCDGSNVSDSASPIVGKPKPNLIEKFTMGVAVSDLGLQGGEKEIQPEGAQGLKLKIHKDGPYDRDGYQAQGDRCRVGHAHGSIPDHDHGGENRPPFVGVVKIIKVR